MSWKIDLNLLPENLVKRDLPKQAKLTCSSGYAVYFSKPPKFQHSDIEFREDISLRGGGRGYFAKKDIEPGELLIAEIPCAEIPDFPLDRDPSERCILNLACGAIEVEEVKKILTDLSYLHPRTLEEIEPTRLDALKNDYSGLYTELKSLPLGNLFSEESFFYRIMCALHFNGFITGVYLHLAMVNHSCAPNSVKWGARDGLPHSELRANRLIPAGEEITFSYLVPTLRAREARRRALSGQFQFDCNCALCLMKTPDCFQLEAGPENVVTELENMLDDIEKSNDLYIDPKKTLQTVTRIRNEAKMKGVTSRSLALAHADMVAVDACLGLLEIAAGSNTSKDEQNLFLTLLTKSVSIRKTQLMLFGVCESLDKTKVKETSSEAEATLQHIASGLAYFTSIGKTGEKFLQIIKDDETASQLFLNAKDAAQCELACDKAARAIADLYLDVAE